MTLLSGRGPQTKEDEIVVLFLLAKYMRLVYEMEGSTCVYEAEGNPDFTDAEYKVLVACEERIHRENR